MCALATSTTPCVIASCICFAGFLRAHFALEPDTDLGPTLLCLPRSKTLHLRSLYSVKSYDLDLLEEKNSVRRQDHGKKFL